MRYTPDRHKGSSTERGYGYRWEQARKGYLRKHPLCVDCESRGKVKIANVVDHIIPHKGNVALFWDSGNWQALCQHCHDSHKALLERTGRIAGCDEHGNPIDPNHHWNKSN